MLELPEAAIISEQLREKCLGKKILRAQAANSKHRFAFYTGDPSDYKGFLEGTKISFAEARAGYIEIGLGRRSLILSDGVNLRYYADPSEAPAKNQLFIELDDGGALCVTVAMYGGIWLCEPKTFDNKYYRSAVQKPNPLTDAFDRARFDSLAASLEFPKLSAKAFLATEQRIPGLGNGCLQDILFNAKINPKRKMGTVDAKGMTALFSSVKKTLAAMEKRGGRDTENDLFGNPGAYKTILSRNTLIDPCPRCGGNLVRAAYLGGNVYFCPDCQA